MMHVSKQISFKGNSFCFGNKNVVKKKKEKCSFYGCKNCVLGIKICFSTLNSEGSLFSNVFGITCGF